MRRRVAVAALCIAVLLAGCGGATAPQSPKAPMVEEMQQGPAASPAPTQPGGERYESVLPESPANAADATSDIGALLGEILFAEAVTQGAGTTCDAVCRALRSMERATERLCDIASGDAEMETCEQARARVEEARRRVKAACGECTEAGTP